MEHWHASVSGRTTNQTVCFLGGNHPKQDAVCWLVSRLDKDPTQVYGIAKRHRLIWDSLQATQDMPDDWDMGSGTLTYSITRIEG